MTHQIDQLSDEEVVSRYVEKMTTSFKGNKSLIEASLNAPLTSVGISLDDGFTRIKNALVDYAQAELERAHPRYMQIATSHLTVEHMRAYLRFLEENPGYEQASRNSGREIGEVAAEVINTVASGFASMIEEIRARDIGWR